MLIYEKNNKLNINFDNEVSEQPDLQISKEDGKTSVKIDGQESGGGSGGTLVVHSIDGTLDKTFAEIKQAMSTSVIILVDPDNDFGEVFYLEYARKNTFGEERYVQFKSISAQPVDSTFMTTEDNGYPVHQ